jgi:aspartokinase
MVVKRRTHAEVEEQHRKEREHEREVKEKFSKIKTIHMNMKGEVTHISRGGKTIKECPIHVKSYCVKTYERKGSNVKGYCVKPHTRKCK